MSTVLTRRGRVSLLAGVLLVAGGCAVGLDSLQQDDGGHVSGPAASSPSPVPTRPPATPTTTPTLSADPSESPSPPAPTTASRDANPQIERLPDKQWARMVDAGVWRPGCPAGRHELRRVEVSHYTFSGDVRRGVLVVNRDVASSIARIFTTLFENHFPIRKMRPVEAYDGDSNASLKDDNTSAMNCRRPSQINAPQLKSPHANGRAIDINPWENPWRDLRCDCWFPNRKNRERSPGPGVIVKGGLVWRTFRAQGWTWQDIDVADYMHFDTGYPSKAYHQAER